MGRASGCRPASADRTGFVAVIIPERSGALDLFLRVFGAGNLPIPAPLAEIGDVGPAVRAMRTAQQFAETAPGLLDGDVGDVADLELAFVVDRAGDHRAVLVDGHRVVAPRAGDAELGIVH